MTNETAIKAHQDRATSVAQAAIYALTLTDALKAICDGWRNEAISLEGAKQRGAVGRQKELRTGASLLMAVALKVEELAPGKQTEPIATTPIATSPSNIPAALMSEHAKLSHNLIQTETGVALAAAAVAGSAHAYIAGHTDNYDPQPNGAQPVQIFNPGELPPANVTTDLRDPQPADPSVPVQLTPSGQVVPFVEQPAPGAAVLNILDPIAAYQPPPRLSFKAVQALWDHELMEPPTQTSFSKITSLENCSLQVLLGRAARRGIIAKGRPQWANVGGTAFHAAIDRVERHLIAPEEVDIAEWWTATLEEAIVTEESTSGIGRSQWRASDGGKENYDWWRVEGEKMVQLYLKAHGPELRAKTQILQLSAGDGQPTVPLLEFATSLDVNGVRIDLIIDQGWLHAENTEVPFALRDLKTGRTEPDTFQLAIYQHALARQWGQPPSRFSSAFWLARKGINSTPIDATALHPWDEIEYRVGQAMAAQHARIAQPRVSSFCHGCEFKAQCPAAGSLQ